MRQFCRQLAVGITAATLLSTASAARAAQPGITGVTHGSVDLRVPASQPPDVNWFYGVGMPIQLDATTGGLLVNIRRQPSPYFDFEVGTDLIKFNSLGSISSATAIPVSRPTPTGELNPWTETPSITVKYPISGGFVPRGGALPNGSANPHAGTGFGMCEVGFYPSDFSQPRPSRVGYQLELQQFAYDGSQFTASSPIRMSTMPVGDTGWKITQPGISPAIFDGSDMLFAVNCSNANGVARFQYGPEGWHPTSFVPVSTTGMEPSLIRDVDGSLLYANRNGTSSVPLWRSTDGGDTWQSLFTASFSDRPDCPVTLNQAVDGTPYLCTSIKGNGREVLQIIPLNSDRTGVGAPIMLRDAPADFETAPSGQGWAVDHGMGNVLRLADGKLHCVQTYRLLEMTEILGWPNKSPYTGFYVEEVFSSGDPISTSGVIFTPEPSTLSLTLLAAMCGLGCAELRRRRSNKSWAVAVVVVFSAMSDLFVAPMNAAVPTQETGNFSSVPVWQDEFSGSPLDMSEWFCTF